MFARPVSGEVRRAALAAVASLGVAVFAQVAGAAVVINEVQYDDSGTDDREFVELYNNGGAPVDISGWTVGARDATTTNPTHTIPGALGSATTVLAPGAYYVLANAGTLNVNQVVAANSFENDTETVELRSGPFVGGTLEDALVYEGSAPFVLPGDVAAQTGGQSYWPNHQGVDVAAVPLNTRTSVGRVSDGRDTNNNGRDWVMRPSTPGSSNATSTMTNYVAPNVDAQADGSDVAGLTGSFVNARAFTPGVVTAGLNPNAIPAPNGGLSKAIVAWDGSGGGNGIVSNAIYDGNGAKYSIQVYLDTADLPVSTNAGGTPFRGSEATYFGLAGGIDAFTNLASVSGQVGLGAANSANGASGVAWYYEKVGVPTAGGPVSEKLYLIDAGDGGNMNTEGANATADEWIVLATIDLSATASGWYDLMLSVDAAGVGNASFNGQNFYFNTAPGLYGEFYVGYRENTQAGAVGVPGYVRPATFAVPEPSGLALLGLGGLFLRRRRA
jgi:hypothetical protein